jgi:hydrogenase maturation factor
MTHRPDLGDVGAVFHCITCSDEALPARVLSVDPEAGLATVSIQSATTEIDISLVGSVVPGDLLLVHGGVALALAEKE